MATRQERLGWWGQRVSHYISHLVDVLPPEGRLRSIRRDQVRIVVARGRLEAQVAGRNRATPFTVALKVKPWSDRDWRKAFSAIAVEGDVARRLLAGNAGPELEALLAESGLELFPEPAANRPVTCTCREIDCRHTPALLVHGAALVDQNPFLWLEVLGRPRSVVLAEVSARLAGPAEAEPLDEARFWRGEADPNGVAVHFEAGLAPDALLRLLGPLPLPVETTVVRLDEDESIRADQLLRQYAAAIGEGSRNLGLGEGAPPPVPEPLPGRPLSMAERLRPELITAVREAGALLSLEEAAKLSPTASALPLATAARALRDAAAELPPDLVSLAGQYIGPREAALQGAVFRHVVTFDDWYRGAPTGDADFVQALHLCGYGKEHAIWANERPEVGDELWIEVSAFGEALRVESLRIPLRRRNLTALQQESLGAIRRLKEHMARTGVASLSAREAIGVLLGAGHYREEAGPDRVLLYPLYGLGLSPGRDGASVTTELRPHRPNFRRQFYQYWTERENAIRALTVSLLEGGARRPEAEQAVACIRWWCQYWTGAQDTVAGAPSVGALLDFLWNVAPLEARRAKLDPERVPVALGAWFRVLADQYAPVREHYQPHIAACGLSDAYRHRLETVPGGGEADLFTWQIEGYRWLGPARCFPQVQP